MIQSLLGKLIPTQRPEPIVCATPDQVEVAEQAFYHAYLKPCMTAFDIGANCGDLTSVFAQLVGTGGYVHAFEPTPATYQRLTERLSRPPVETHQLAVSAAEGTADLHVYDDDHDKWNTLAARPLEKYGIDIKPQGTESVPVTTLDTFCADRDINRIDLLKIDIEGAELQALQGARRLLRHRAIGAIVFEFGQTTFDMGNSPEAIAEYLAACGYRLENVVSGDPLFPGGESPQTARFSMLLARPEA
ncbi:MAG: FkbM family methyltransferase [Phycisphaeraceae bacterium]